MNFVTYRKRVRGVSTGGGGGGGGGGAYAGVRWSPRYTLPTTAQYNQTTGLVDLSAAKETALAYATNAPSVWVTVTDTGTTAGNKSALSNAIANAVAASGTAGVNTLRGIKLKAGVDYGQGFSTDTVHLVDNIGTPVWLYIVSENVGGTLRAEGQRVGLDDVTVMAKFGVTTYNVPVFDVGPNSRRIRFVGCHFRTDPTVLASLQAGNYGYPGNGTGAVFHYIGFIGRDTTIYPPTYPTLPAYRETGNAADIIVDRCILQADDSIRYLRVLLANFDRFACLDSWLECAGSPNSGDSQCISVLTCAGNHVIRNNELANAWGENILYGGGATGALEYLPSDIYIVGNLFTFRDRWDTTGQNRLAKNRIELKVGVRVVIERNEFEKFYGYGRVGNQYHAVVFKTADQGSFESWVKTRDVTCRLNRLTRCSGGFVLQGGDRAIPNVAEFKSTYRVDISHNLMVPWDQSGIGLGYTRPTQFGGFEAGTFGGDPEGRQITDIAMHHNTMWGADDPTAGGNYQRMVQYLGGNDPNPPMTRLEFQNNVLAGVNLANYTCYTWVCEESGILLNGLPTGWTALTKTAVTTGGNFISGVQTESTQLTAVWGSGRGVQTLASMDLNSATLALNVTSPGKGVATDGGDPGVDQTLLTTALTRSRTGRS